MHADMKVSTGSVSLGMEEVTCRSGIAEIGPTN